eukprot:368298-Amphidinium_carterae.1
MDRSVPVEQEAPAAAATQLLAEGTDHQMHVPVYRVGPHRCRLTAGDTRITCMKCERYVTTYKGTWRNMGTIAKQPCKPKARRQKGREGKAPTKQSGGALPALPPGTRPRGRVPRPSKKQKTHDSRAPTAPSGCVTQKEQTHDSRPPIAPAGRATLTPKSSRAEAVPQPFLQPRRIEEAEASSSAPQLQCGLCRGHFPARGLHSREIREQFVQVCGECLTARPKTLPKFQEVPKKASEKRCSE